MLDKRTATYFLALATLCIPARARAQHDSSMMAAHHHMMSGTSSSDSAFRAMQMRGDTVMGVNQLTTTHRFDSLVDGGSITLESDSGDSADIARIRTHFGVIAREFAAGDFTDPSILHETQVPGTDVMAAKRALITYTVLPTPRGASLRILTKDRAAIDAIHSFLAFQRDEHHAAGTTSP